MVSEDSRKSAFFALYNQAQLRLFSYLLAMVHSKNDADDIMQETAVVLWDKFDQFEEGTNFGAWALDVARKKAFEHMRKNERTKVFFSEEFYESVSQLAFEDSSSQPNRLEALAFCLDKLPAEGRRLLSMRYRKAIPVKRIAHLTGRSANGLYQSFSRMVKALRECMDRHARQAV